MATKEPKSAGMLDLTADDMIINVITTKYKPEAEDDEQVDYLTTMEIIEQFSSITEINKSFLADELAANGFTIENIADEYRWKLVIK